ncbi:MAG: acetoacetate decarboxylase family protein [Rhizobiaceae bacterium]
MLGRSSGPRNMPKSRKHLKYVGDSVSVNVTATVDETSMNALLPPGFKVTKNPRLLVGVTMLTNLGWLAGRGYNIIRVTTEVEVEAKRGPVVGNLALVLWENHPDPILTGREELASPKLFANIPDARFVDDEVTATADWEGFRFFELRASKLTATALSPDTPTYAGGGAKPLICHRHHASIGDWTKPALAEIAISTPPEADMSVTLEHHVGVGEFAFHPARWEDMPTQYTYVSTLARLPITGFCGASVVKARGIGDLAAMTTLPV